MATSDPEKLIAKADKLICSTGSTSFKSSFRYMKSVNHKTVLQNRSKFHLATTFSRNLGHDFFNPVDKMISTKLTLTRWSADWRNATQYYEQAATAFRFAKKHEKAKVAFEKASKGQEMLSSPWDAAKHMESAAALVVELSIWSEVADFYRRASELYNECGRSQPASDALAKGARALEDAKPDDAIAMYTDAILLLEDDGKENMVSDIYRAITNVYIKLEKYTDAASFLLRWAVASNKCNALHSQCKAYLSAIIVYLYAHDFKQADQCYNDCCQIDTFLSSDQSHCASKLLSAYREADVEEIQRVAKSSTVSNLDHMIIRLARKIPTGELVAMEINSMEQGEALDEDDLT